MELKLVRNMSMLGIPTLLIVPYGIEPKNILQANIFDLLLIVPYGIETEVEA